MIVNINGKPVMVEVKHSSLEPIMKTRSGNLLFKAEDGRFVATDVNDVRASLVEDRNSFNQDAVCAALQVELDVNLAGGWDEVLTDALS